MSNTLCAASLLFGLPMLIAALSANSEAAEEPPSQERVAAVAVMLPEHAKGVGRPITDRAAWKDLAARPSYDGVIARAEKLLQKPIPDQPDDLYLDFSKTGNRTRWQNVAFERRGRVTWLVLAECLENKGRFLPAFEELVAALCAERTWVMPAHDRSLRNFKGEETDIDLASSALAWNLATASYLLGDKLSAEARRLIRENVGRRVLDPYVAMVNGKLAPNWWMKTTNNWNAVCLAGVTGAALALLDSRQERALFVVAAERYSMNFLRGFTPDGYCSEGVGYWNYGFGHYVLLAETIYQATDGGVDLMGRKEVRAPAMYGARIQIINGVCPAFADCSVTARPSSRIMQFVSRRFRLGMRQYEGLDVSLGGSLPESMIYSFPNSASRTPPADSAAAGPGLRTWFEQAGVLIGRPAEGSTCRMGVALKGGNNAEHHNHNDVGSYVVVVGQRPVLLDPGAEVYTARTFSSKRYESKLLNSYGHPVPVVAGKLQRPGREAQGKALRTDFTDAADTLVLDMSSAYDVPDLQKLKRTFVYSREESGSLTVRDEVAFSAPETFGTALITAGEWQRLGPDALLVYDFDEAVRVRIEATGGEFEVQADEIHEEAKVQPTRLGINFTQPVTSASITVTITPMPMPGEGGGALLRNGGFENRRFGWSIPKDGIGSISAEQAASGKFSLKIEDPDKKQGSNISSARMPAQAGRTYELRGKAFHVSGEGVGMYVKYYNEKGEMLNPRDERGYIAGVGTLDAAAGRWAPFAFRFETPKDTASIALWIHSYTGAEVVAYLDDLAVVPTGER